MLIENFPIVSFHGASFEFDEDSKRIRNLLHDYFNRGTSPREGDLLGLTRLYISVIYEDNVFHFRFYISKIVTSMMEKSTWTSEVRLAHPELPRRNRPQTRHGHQTQAHLPRRHLQASHLAEKLPDAESGTPR